jgi:hypothetical protein
VRNYTLKTLDVNGRCMTKNVFRQLPEYFLHYQLAYRGVYYELNRTSDDRDNGNEFTCLCIRKCGDVIDSFKCLGYIRVSISRENNQIHILAESLLDSKLYKLSFELEDDFPHKEIVSELRKDILSGEYSHLIDQIFLRA